MDNSAVKSLYALACKLLPHREVMNRLRESIHQALAERGIEVPADAAILYDDVHERVVITHGEYVWSGDAALIANNAAESTLQAIVDSNQQFTRFLWQSAEISLQNSSLVRGFFWFFNGVVILYWCAWFVQFIFSPDFREWYETARISSSFGLLGMLLFLLLPAIPLAVTLYQLIAKYLHTERRISYGHALLSFELPAFVATFITNYLLIEAPLTPALRIFIAILFITILVFWFTASHHLKLQSQRTQLVNLVALVITFTSALYVSLLTIVPLYFTAAESVATSFFDDFASLVAELLRDPMVAFMLLVGLIFWLVPVVIYFFVVRRAIRFVRRTYSTLAGTMPRAAHAVLYGTPSAFFVLLLVLSIQPSVSEYERNLLLIAQEDSIYENQLSRATGLTERKEKVDKALAHSLYADEMYLFDRSDFDDPWRNPLTNAYISIIAFPFIYDDSNGGISYTEREAILTGYQLVYGIPFGYDPEEGIAPIKQVQLLNRDVHVQTHQNPILAEVTVTDSLGTFTSLDQEVVYEFSLPEHAVVTGLRLGTALEHIGQIAPRGAAQELYTNEVRGMRDPALLEQTGPRQYRLRVYPVPGTSKEAEMRRREEVAGMTQRVQYSYIVLREAEGIPMPRFTEEYNLLTNETALTVVIDGATANLSTDGAFITDRRVATQLCSSAMPVTAQISSGMEVKLVVGTASDGSTLPYCNHALDSATLLSNVRNKSILFLIDTSFSEREGALSTQLATLASFSSDFFRQNNVEYRLFSNTLGVTQHLTEAHSVPGADELTYYGRGDILYALASAGNRHDVVVVVTGTDDVFMEQPIDRWNFGYTSQAGSQTLTNLNSTNVVFWHGREAIPSFPPLIIDKLSAAKTMSVTTDIQSILAQIIASDFYGGTLQLIGPYWHIATSYLSDEQSAVMMGGQSSDMWSLNALKAISERQYISTASRPLLSSSYGYQYNNYALDALHNQARNLGIVTPLSSYIALVNQTQQQQLDTLTGRVDRYTSTQQFNVSQPQLMNPLSVGFGGFGATSVGLDSSATFDLPTAPSSMSDGGGGGFDVSGTKTSAGGEEVGMLPRLLVLTFTIILFGSVIGAVVWWVRRKRKA